MLEWLRTKRLDFEQPRRLKNGSCAVDRRRLEPKSEVAIFSSSRPVGPIAGIVHSGPAAIQAMRSAAPQGCQLLTPVTTGSSIVADWDCCEFESKPIRGIDDWQTIIRLGRLADVNGAFTLAWIDEHGALCLARDSIGERTLFYAPIIGNGFAFASSIKVLLDSGLVPRSLNVRTVALFLTFAYVPGSTTLVHGIEEILPGAIVAWRDGKIEHRTYWRLPSTSDGMEFQDENAVRIRLREELERAVDRRLPESEPVAATLSGGLDSSLVVALARRRHLGEITSLSISFGSDYPNELAYSSAVAQHCGVPHRVVDLTPAMVVHNLDSTISLLSQPIGDPLTVPNAILFREAANYSDVVLNGEGGDPCFGGPKNLPMILAELYKSGSEKRLERARSYLRAHLKCFDDLESMLTPEAFAVIADAPIEATVIDALHDDYWPQFLSRMQALNIFFKGAHNILPKIDQLSVPYGVLPRSPLFDRRVADLAMRLPPSMKQRGSEEKYLLKRAVEDILPKQIIDRPKSGMLVPVEGWFHGPLKSVSRDRLLGSPILQTLVQRDYLETLLAGRLGGLRPRHGVKIWLLITLESWIRTVLGR